MDDTSRPRAHEDDAEWVHDDEDTLRPAPAPAPLRSVLSDLVERRRWGDRLEGAAVFSRWEELVGAQLAARCEPVRLAGGVLTVRAENAAWATEVGYLVGQITERAAAVLRPGLVRDVKVVIGPLEGTARGRGDDPPSSTEGSPVAGQNPHIW